MKYDAVLGWTVAAMYAISIDDPWLRGLSIFGALWNVAGSWTIARRRDTAGEHGA